MEQRTNIEALQQRLPFYKIRKEMGRHKQFNWQEEWDRFDARKTFEFDLSSIPEGKLSELRSRQEVLLDGNHAALSVLERVVDGLCGYPITPSTAIAEDFAKAAADGKKNVFGQELMYFQPSDELSAIAAVEATMPFSGWKTIAGCEDGYGP